MEKKKESQAMRKLLKSTPNPTFKEIKGLLSRYKKGDLTQKNAKEREHLILDAFGECLRNEGKRLRVFGMTAKEGAKLLKDSLFALERSLNFVPCRFCGVEMEIEVSSLIERGKHPKTCTKCEKKRAHQSDEEFGKLVNAWKEEKKEKKTEPEKEEERPNGNSAASEDGIE